MAVPIDSIQRICKEITFEIEQAFEGLSLYFVIHHVGKMREAIALAEHEIVSHPAGNAARAIIRKHSKGEHSSFLGLAISNENKMMGFKKIDHLLGLFNVNANEFESEDQVRAEVYHLAWHAVDLYEIRQEPNYRRKFKSGPMVPKRSPLNLSKAHLQADAFSAALSTLKGNTNALDLIAKKRGKQALIPINDFKAEDYPSIIAKDACKFAIEEMLQTPVSKEEHIRTARQISLDVGQTFDEANIQQWWDFSIPAQDMAWRGFTMEEVLGAAINICEDPFVRSIGYLIQECTDIEPATSDSMQHTYNAFLDPEVNLKLHREMVDTIFEDAIAQGIDDSSSRALLDAANKQNEHLTEGRFLGWCANALQDAAKAFERALLNGASPDQAARMQFEGNRSEPAWESLLELGNKIVDQKRQGFAVTMGHIAEICHNNPSFGPVLDSIKITMNDPAYISKLEAANDLAIKPAAPGPKAPAPKGPELAPKGPELGPKGPAPTAAPPMPPMAPGMGGGNRAAQLMRHRQQMLDAQKEKDSQDSGDRT